MSGGSTFNNGIREAFHNTGDGNQNFRQAKITAGGQVSGGQSMPCNLNNGIEKEFINSNVSNQEFDEKTVIRVGDTVRNSRVGKSKPGGKTINNGITGAFNNKGDQNFRGAKINAGGQVFESMPCNLNNGIENAFTISNVGNQEFQEAEIRAGDTVGVPKP